VSGTSGGAKAPGKLYAYNVPLLLGSLGLGGALGMHARFVRGFNILWLAASALPFATCLVYNASRQPK